MVDANWISSVAAILTSFLSGGGLVGLVVRKRDKERERERERREHARKVVLDLTPKMQIAEQRYKRFLSDSLYMRDVEGDIEAGEIPIIRGPGRLPEWRTAISGSALDPIRDRLALELANIDVGLQILDDELAQIQSDLNYGYDHPADIARRAKGKMERELADLLLGMHDLRRALVTTHLGRTAWPRAGRRERAAILALVRRSHSQLSLSERAAAVMRRVSLMGARSRFRMRRDWRRMRAWLVRRDHGS